MSQVVKIGTAREIGIAQPLLPLLRRKRRLRREEFLRWLELILRIATVVQSLRDLLDGVINALVRPASAIRAAASR
jgi:hypothetical protein